MSYGNGELSQAEERELDLEMLREDLVGELNAINQYQDHIDSLENEEAVQVLRAHPGRREGARCRADQAHPEDGCHPGGQVQEGRPVA